MIEPRWDMIESYRDSTSGDRYLGESSDIEERLIVSPGWGRLRPCDVSSGQEVEVGMVLGHLDDGNGQIPILSHVQGVFVAWLAWGGERVPPGRALARLSVAN
jgi:biotin carboxyl carrier protein